MKLSFLGAAQEVTGSCFLVETADTRFLVDCGMVQGGRDAPAHNRAEFAFDPASIDFVLLTHAHLDHSGLLPRLTRAGFRGPIYATAATVDLLGAMLPDSAHIQEGDARRDASRSRGRNPAAPLYTLQDARECLEQARSMDYDQAFAPRAEVHCRFRDAGHILGSATVEVSVTEDDGATRLVFSGDLGHPGRPILRDPTPIDEPDILVIESTYGNRVHRDRSATEDEMIALVERTLFERGGNVIMPAFAVGHTQQVLYHLHRLAREGRLRHPMVFVDSPMATEATRITREHLGHNLPRRECSVLIPGFQAQGTLGRRLVDGAKQVRMFGEDIPVRAEIRSVDDLSAHADQAALPGWAGAFRKPPAHTFVVHGEPTAAQALAHALRETLGWRVTVPVRGHAERWPAGTSS